MAQPAITRQLALMDFFQIIVGMGNLITPQKASINTNHVTKEPRMDLNFELKRAEEKSFSHPIINTAH